MRPIKFRAWDGNEMFQDWLVMEETLEQVVVTQRSRAAKVVMQFTGLLDKNGKEIWEGDIVKKYREVNPDYGYDIAEVRWNVTRGAFEIVGDDPMAYGYLYKPKEKIEVIGNVHENPDLLNPT